MGLFNFFSSKGKALKYDNGTLIVDSNKRQSPFAICYREREGILLPVKEEINGAGNHFQIVHGYAAYDPTASYYSANVI